MHETKATILAVDDEAEYLKLFERTFSREYHILTALSAREGLETLAKHPEISVIVSDQRMPDMTGLEMLRRSRVQNPDKIRIILTGYADPSDLIAAINSSRLFCYMAKPWVADQMGRVLRRAVNVYLSGGFDSHDETTGLPNHLSLNRILRREMKRAKAMGTVLCVLGFSFHGLPLRSEQYDEEELSYKLSQMIRELFSRLTPDGPLCCYRPLAFVGLLIEPLPHGQSLDDVVRACREEIRSSAVFQTVRTAHPNFDLQPRGVVYDRASSATSEAVIRAVLGL